MNTKQAELLKLQTNAEEQDSSNLNSKLIQREKIEGTPFYIITQPSEELLPQYFAIMGNTMITPIQTTKENVLQYIDNNQWEITLTMILIVNKKQNQQQ